MKYSKLLYLLFLLVLACKSRDRLFIKQSSSHTNIHFDNKITENDSVNPIDLEFLYNGGGVACGDFNNDGLQDLYFTGSQVSNKLYLNKGDFVFEDITIPARVTGDSMWSNGASVIDINADGLQDIYVCTTIYKDANRRRNLLYINQGNNKEGIPVFKEMAAEYHLADTGYSVQAGFFDYDNDGDLDMYLVQTKLAQRDIVQLSGRNADSTGKDADKLFRNDWSDSLGHPVFTDVSIQAGIKEPGYGLGLSIADINNDGWKDIYVTNDFYGNDLLYINNHNGTFTNKAASCFSHTSQNAMGNDIADINGDGLPDILAVDMNPEDNYRKKKNMGGNNYYIYQSMLNEGYILQYVRNTLQINNGPQLFENDSTGVPVFSDVSYLAGVAETDWSWNAAIVDMDNDGHRDICITNGYPRDVTDHDFLAFRARSGNIATKEQLIEEIPRIKISNYAYRNKGNMQFDNAVKSWGFDEPCFSNGAVYADLDNDGDLDYVINNINDEAFVYRNTLHNKDKSSGNFLKMKFNGEGKNKDGIGAVATIYYNNMQQVWENAPVRGYLSCVENTVLFGLDSIATVDSVIVRWNSGKQQKLVNVKSNQTLVVSEKDASGHPELSPTAKSSLFTEVTARYGINYRHLEKDYIDFNDQRLIPHKFSEYGPGVAVGDIDNNGYDDICIGSNEKQTATLLLQQSDGRFLQKELPIPVNPNESLPETQGILLFDADSDGDLDLYFASGGSESPANSIVYRDRFFENDGKGNFSYQPNVLPANYTSKSCIKAADIDHDGDLDLFIGGRLLPGRYPQAVSSFIYRNDSKKGTIKFTDVTASIANGLQSVGLICDALWTDFDNDGWTDLIVTGEWMTPGFFKNNSGKLVNITASAGLQNAKGWWNSITGGDFDNDGDIDYIAGNLGTNTYYRATEQYPMHMYSGDFAKNNNYVGITSLYLTDSLGNKREYPAQTRDDIIEQMPALKKKFLTYKKFAVAAFSDLLDKDTLKSAYKLEANYMQTAYIENLGNGKFRIKALPWCTQTSPVYGMVADDFNQDGNLDIAMVGNDYGTEVSIGRYDALKGLVLSGDGKGNFSCLTMAQAGFCVPGNGKALVKLRGAGDRYLLAASQNKDALKLFGQRTSSPLIPFSPGDQYAMITLKNGRKRKEEVYHGSSFLSQSSLFTTRSDQVSEIEMINAKGLGRKIAVK